MKTILVADDKPSNRELIRVILESSGHQVIEASNGREAVDLALEHEPDLLLLDLQMPELDGFNVLSEVRKDNRFTSRPIVALTAYAMQGDREKALAAGFTSYVTKPVNLAALRSLVSDLLGAAGGKS
jgi:two-component system cell cycle response regulator DivK